VLYTGYEAMEGTLPVYLFATLGDVAYTLGAVLLISFFAGSLVWFVHVRTQAFLGLAVIGFSIALFVEYKAMALMRWEYTEAMPLVWDLGVSPLVQMTLLLPLSVFLSMVVERRIRGTLGT
jgi:hypothetical protein